jgi:hypothetical protein
VNVTLTSPAFAKNREKAWTTRGENKDLQRIDHGIVLEIQALRFVARANNLKSQTSALYQTQPHRVSPVGEQGQSENTQLVLF